jgi:hypothetical protein
MFNENKHDFESKMNWMRFMFYKKLYWEQVYFEYLLTEERKRWEREHQREHQRENNTRKRKAIEYANDDRMSHS